MSDVLTEVEAGGNKYRVMRMNGRDQMHVFRRILPFIMPLIVTKLKGLKTNPVDIMLVMLREISSMADVDYDHIRVKCLAATMREQTDGRYAAVMLGDREMFMDISGPAQLTLIGAVIKENIVNHAQDFSDALLVLMPTGDSGETAST
jgi:hypothetical protein